MAIQLKKGNSISLKKEAPGLSKIMLGLGWDMTTMSVTKNLFDIFKANRTIDLDSSVFCLDSNDKLRDTSDVVYYANLTHRSGAIRHQGDNLTGAGDGDDEQILVDLDQVPAEISTLLFTVNIYMAKERSQDFSGVRNAFVRLVDLKTQQEIAHYKLSGEGYAGQTALLMAELRRQDNGWIMKAIGEGLARNLDSLIRDYR
jgi:tellurium resistance protein TerD